MPDNGLVFDFAVKYHEDGGQGDSLELKPIYPSVKVIKGVWPPLAQLTHPVPRPLAATGFP